MPKSSSATVANSKNEEMEIERLKGSHSRDKRDDDTHNAVNTYDPEVLEQKYKYRPLSKGLLDQFSLEDKIKKSEIDKVVSEQRRSLVDVILEKFNEDLGGRSFVEDSRFRGKLIQPNQVKLVEVNGLSQLVKYQEMRQRRKRYYLNAGRSSNNIGVFNIKHPIYGAGGKFVINIPEGKVGKVWLEGNDKSELLGEGTHVLHNPNLRFDPSKDIVKFDQPYIQHGNLHILQLKSGEIAKVYLNHKPYLLFHRDEPYIFEDPTFKLVEKNKNELFHSENEDYFEHGSLRYIMPKPGHVHVGEFGQILVLEQKKDGNPIILDAPRFESLGTMQVNTQTVQYPTGNRSFSCTTRDGLTVEVKLTISFNIANPTLVLNNFKIEDVENHIFESCKTEMTRAVQGVLSTEFLQSSQTQITGVRTREEERLEQSLLSDGPSAPKFYEYLQDQTKKELATDLIEVGINLTKLNIGTFELDKTSKDALAKTAVESVKMKQKQETLLMQGQIEEQEARQKAEAALIKINAANERKLALARAEIEEQKLIAEAMGIEDAANTERGKVYQQFPQILEYEKSKMMAEALAKTRYAVVSPGTMGGLMFQGPAGLAALESDSVPAAAAAVSQRVQVR